MSRTTVFPALTVACWTLFSGACPEAHGQQAMPPSIVIAEENPVNIAPMVLAPQIMELNAGPQAFGPMTPQSGLGLPNYGASGEPYDWQLLPAGLIYKSYLAGGRETRLGSQWVVVRDGNWLWDATIGGRVGVLRYGDESAVSPQGWQLDAEGAVFPRLLLDSQHQLVSVDFRCGFPLTWRRGPLESKLGYYHLSSHLGDEFMVNHLGATPINFTRDSLVWGVALRPSEDVRLYGEADWSFYNDGGSKPWQFQFGIDYSPAEPSGSRPNPFLAVNARLREDLDYSGNFTAQAGLQWRSQAGRLLRLGAYYFNGSSDQNQFFRRFEELIGLGVWYDY